MGAQGFDVALDTLADELFGAAVDHRELFDVISKQSDASEVHVMTGAAKSKHKKKQVMNTVGQGLNALAMGAGTHALIMAGRDERLNSAGAADAAAGKKTFARAASAPYRKWQTTGAHKYLRSKMGVMDNGKNAKYAIAAAGGGLLLHSAELVGDSIAAQALREQRRQSSPNVKSVVVNRAAAKTSIRKALDDIITARRRGIINTDTAIDMASELVAKAGIPEADHIHREAEALVPNLKAKLKPLSYKAPTAQKAPNRPLQRKPLAAPAPIAKSDAPVITWTGEIAKRDDEKRQVFGYAMVTHIDGEPVVDRQGDYTPLDEIEKAAYSYVIESRKGGDMHTRDGDKPLHTSDLVESFVVTPEKLVQMGLAEDAMPHGWWVGFKVNDDKQWDMVKSGERTGFSIHGSGRRVEKML
jgi:hypothetical protein